MAIAGEPTPEWRQAPPLRQTDHRGRLVEETALERARREALLKQVGGESKPRRRRTAADARPPSMEPSTLHSVSEE